MTQPTSHPLPFCGATPFSWILPKALTPNPHASKIPALLAEFCLSVSSDPSAIVYGDGDGLGQVGGGIGTWDTTSLRWSTTSDGNTYQAWNNATGDDAVFSVAGTGAAPGAVAAGAAITA